MYVIPTPFWLVEGATHHRTLILPTSEEPGSSLVQVGELVRRESDEVVTAYTFDLQTNTIAADTIPNPHAGREHVFRAWRLKGDPEQAVSLRRVSLKDMEEDMEAADGD